MSQLRIIFAGTPEFAAVALQALLDAQYKIVAVYTQPDRPAGRGRKLTPSPVKQLALQHDIPVEQPLNFKTEQELQQLKDYTADLMIVAAYGLLLPVAVLETPRLGCLNIHASLLPRWRGAAPIQRAILAGDAQTGITIMQMDKGLDTGAMLLKLDTPIEATDTGGSLHDRLAQLGGRAILQALQLLEENNLKPESQVEAQACYAKKLDKHEAWINWADTAEQIDRQIRAFVPWPVSQTQLDDKIVRIHAARIEDRTSKGTPGEILSYDKNAIEVQCGQGRIRLIKCQLPGARAMDMADLHNGHPQLFQPGLCFSRDPS